MGVVLFPGQGSQAVGMGRFYYEQFSLARQLFKEASDTLNLDFAKLCFEGSIEELTKTENAQPASLLVSVVAWECLSQEVDLTPIKYSAGHSVGEYSALVASQVLPFSLALKAVRQRGLYMSDPLVKGGMSALIGASDEEVAPFCQWVQQKSGLSPLEPANFNSPQQTVISGVAPALKWAKEHLKEYPFSSQKVRLIPLKVGGGFHSSLMEGACKKLAVFLKDVPFSPPDKTIVQNRTGEPTDQTQALKQNLIEQVAGPVLWLKSMQYLLKQNCQLFLELGEGQVLAGLMKKIDLSKTVLHFKSLKDISAIQKGLKNNEPK